MMDRQKIAQRVISVLKMKGMTQVELAKASGVPTSSISNVINGGSYSKKVIKKIADVLEVSPGFLMGEIGGDIQENIPPKLFSICVTISANTLIEEKVEVESYNQIVKLALDLCVRHQDKKVDVFKEPENAQSFLSGIVKNQLDAGLITRKTTDLDEDSDEG
jgi:transcriptional regulator with XRE-family HTH domain